MAEAGPATPAPASEQPKMPATGSFTKQRKGFISPTSSFIDFGNIEDEYYTQEGREQARYYNPHKNRIIKKPTSDFEVAIHLLKGSVGAGLLAMPNAFTNVGVVSGLIITIFLTILCIYSMDVLLSMQYIQCQRLKAPFIPLPASMRIGFKNGPRCLRCLAPITPWIVDFFLISCQLGFCTAYVLFIAKSIQRVVAVSMGGFDDADKVAWDLKICILIIFIPVCLTNYIRDLKKLMPLSLLANILIAVSLCGCLYYMFFVGKWKTSSCKMVVGLERWPLFIGTVLFALEAVGVIIALEHNMEKPEHFLGPKGIFPWCLSLVAALYVIIGCLGYLKYGPEVGATIFDSLPKNQWFALIIYAMYGFCIFLTYPLQCFVSLEILWGNYIRHVVKDPMKECMFEYILRTVTVIVTFVAALAIPDINIVIDLIGVFCLSTLGMIFPFTLELVTRYPNDYGPCKWVIIKDIFLIILGCGILILGTYVTLQAFFQSKKH